MKSCSALLLFLLMGAAFPACGEEQLAAGKILVADKRLRDPSLSQSVILLINNDEEGAMGLVLNRESDIPIATILDGVEAAKGRKDTAFTGGPVEPKSVLALLRTRSKPDGDSQKVTGQIYVLLDQPGLEKALSAAIGPDQLRLYVGYAGWKPGQLEEEYEAGAWHVFSGDAASVFDNDPETLWERLLKSEGMIFAKSQPRRLPVRVARLLHLRA